MRWGRRSRRRRDLSRLELHECREHLGGHHDFRDFGRREPGTEDCVCEQPPNYPQEDSEPNETEPAYIAELDDFDPTFEVVDGRLPPGGDEDMPAQDMCVSCELGVHC